jgi:hypothetical protein
VLDEPDWAYPDEYWYPNFEWFRQQVAARLHISSDHRPFRAATIKPDLRLYRHLQPLGRWVRLGLCLTRDQVLLFDDCEWFCRAVVNHYVARTEAEKAVKRAWEIEIKSLLPEVEGTEDFQILPDQLPEPFASRLIASWEKVFDIEGIKADCIWGAFERIHLDQVIDVTEFEGRSRWSSS